MKTKGDNMTSAQSEGGIGIGAIPRALQGESEQTLLSSAQAKVKAGIEIDMNDLHTIHNPLASTEPGKEEAVEEEWQPSCGVSALMWVVIFGVLIVIAVAAAVVVVAVTGGDDSEGTTGTTAQLRTIAQDIVMPITLSEYTTLKVLLPHSQSLLACS